MWKKRLSAFFAGLNAVIAIELSKWLISPNINVPASIALISSALIAAIAQRIIEFLAFEAPLSFQATRGLVDPISRIEGDWLEKICKTEDNSCHFSYAHIEYIVDEQKYRYYGESYTPDFQLLAIYEADQLYLVGDKSKVRMHYSFEAKLHKMPIVETESDTVTGYGVLSFYSDGSKTFNRGGGYFIDNSGVTVRERRVTMKRIKTKKPFSDETEIKQVVEEMAKDF